MAGDRCENESEYLLTLARKEGFNIKDFAKVESEFDEFKKGAFSSEDTIDEMKASLANLTRTVFPTRPWPLSLYPMGSMHIVFASLYTNSNCHDRAAIHSLKGCLAATVRSGHIWVNLLHTLLAALRALMIEEEIAWVNSPGTEALRDYFNGVLDELLVQSRKVYGIDSAYTAAVAKWHAARLPFTVSPGPGEGEFATRFMVAQANVLVWAGIDDASISILLSECW